MNKIQIERRLKRLEEEFGPVNDVVENPIGFANELKRVLLPEYDVKITWSNKRGTNLIDIVISKTGRLNGDSKSYMNITYDNFDVADLEGVSTKEQVKNFVGLIERTFGIYL